MNPNAPSPPDPGSAHRSQPVDEFADSSHRFFTAAEVRRLHALQSPPPQYRLNRRAATVVGSVFLTITLVTAVLVGNHLRPERRAAHYRDSAASFAAQGRYEQAAFQFENLVRLTPEDADATFELARVQLMRLRELPMGAGDSHAGERQRLFAEATAHLEQTLRLDPDHAEACRWLLELAVLRRDRPAAKRLLEVCAHSDSPAAVDRMAHVLAAP